MCDLAILRERFVDLWIGRKARRLEAGFDHPESAEREDRPLERLVGLQADDHLVVAIDVAGLVSQQRRRRLGVDGEHALLAFLLEIRLQLGPHSLGAFGRAREKLLVALDYAREGDTLVVTKLDRLARSARHLSELVDKLECKDVTLRILNFGGDVVDTRGASCGV